MLPLLAVAALLNASEPTAPASVAAPVEVKGASAAAPAPAAGGANPASKRSARKSAPSHGKVASTDAAPASPAPAPTPAPAPAAPAPSAAALHEANEALVEQKCGKCHDVSLAYSAELSDAHWRTHMKRMARVPGAAITDEQARRIHAHLKTVTGRR